MEYLYLRRKGHVPWGYELDEFDPQLCKPIKEHLDVLNKGLKYLEGSSYREVAVWISKKTGCYLSTMGLHYIAKKEHDKRYPPSEAEATELARIKAEEKDKRRCIVEAKRAERSKRTEARRARKATREKQIREDRASKGYLNGQPKHSLTPRLAKQSLRDRRRSAHPRDILC
jgi:hypothetical protein